MVINTNPGTLGRVQHKSVNASRWGSLVPTLVTVYPSARLGSDHESGPHLKMASESSPCLMKATENEGRGLGKYKFSQLPFGHIVYPKSHLHTFFSDLFSDNCRIISGERTYLGVRSHLGLNVVWLVKIWRYKDVLLNKYRLRCLISFIQSQASAFSVYGIFGKPQASCVRLSFLW